MTDSANSSLRRNLQARHLTMIAIGGSIGTGLFVASGATISMAGPGGALLAYGIIGLMVYFLMTSLGELAAFMPESGSFATYGSRYVDPALGFALGWNYWYNWAITIAVDLVAAQLVMRLDLEHDLLRCAVPFEFVVRQSLWRNRILVRSHQSINRDRDDHHGTFDDYRHFQRSNPCGLGQLGHW